MIDWHYPPTDLALTREDVHVWRVPLDLIDPSYLQGLTRLLAEDEVNRADRFRFPHHRDHFIIARGTLRLLLGRYLGVDVYRGAFVYNAYGRPSLPALPAEHPLEFNLSHSGGLALYALSWQRSVGVDVEAMRDIEFEEIATRFFSPREQAVLTALPPHQRKDAFFNAWTRKEAYIKARGEGLSLALDAFDVTLTPGDPATLLETRDDPVQATRWKLQALHAGAGYQAALAVDGGGWQLSCWQWQPPRLA
ncbi:MAG: 4'-phosphopantetheinyl transferase superfamily protein [Ardenticatenales bacterium]|nr:4'-phosphopantetheinyl transferase superfamily protein [Ardenticatenales bacterium]